MRTPPSGKSRSLLAVIFGRSAGATREPLYITTRADTVQVTLVPPGTWEVDSGRSTVGFEVRHLKISRVRGCFREVAAVVSCDSGGVGSIEATISVASI